MESQPKIISCEVLRNEVERVNPGYEVEFFEGALHDYPDRHARRHPGAHRRDARRARDPALLRALQQRHGRPARRPAPPRPPRRRRLHLLLLGSRQRYLDEHSAQPGTYYYTRGWIDFIRDPYTEYREIVPKYGEEKAARVARLIMEHYTRLAVIDTPEVGGLDEKQEYLETVSAFYDLPIEYLTGSLRYLEKLMTGPHDEEFLIVEPGEELEESRFWALSAV